jgi:hypothetical protein
MVAVVRSSSTSSPLLEPPSASASEPESSSASSSDPESLASESEGTSRSESSLELLLLPAQGAVARDARRGWGHATRGQLGSVRPDKTSCSGYSKTIL